MLKKLKLLLIPALLLSFGTVAKAETYKFAVGEWAPYVSKDLPGFGEHATKITETYKKAGIDVEFEFMKWTRVYELVKTGKAIGSFTYTKTAEREGEINYPQNPMSKDVYNLYYMKSKFPTGLGTSKLEELVAKNLKFVGVKTYWYEKPLKDLKADLKMVGEGIPAWKILKSGRVDVFISLDKIADSHIAEVFGADTASVGHEVEPVRVAEGFPIFSKSRKSVV